MLIEKIGKTKEDTKKNNRTVLPVPGGMSESIRKQKLSLENKKDEKP